MSLTKRPPKPTVAQASVGFRVYLPGHLGSARSGEDVARSPAALLGHYSSGAAMSVLDRIIRKIKDRRKPGPQRPSGPAQPQV